MPLVVALPQDRQLCFSSCFYPQLGTLSRSHTEQSDHHHLLYNSLLLDETEHRPFPRVSLLPIILQIRYILLSLCTEFSFLKVIWKILIK
uniref:Uncharacterized protein n=1 Tax=Nothoprocta perdicaria TaxID=30464 RepID=A0A8C6ZIV5_NOTPE